jgi:hypothetical protein
MEKYKHQMIGDIDYPPPVVWLDALTLQQRLLILPFEIAFGYIECMISRQYEVAMDIYNEASAELDDVCLMQINHCSEKIDIELNRFNILTGI